MALEEIFGVNDRRPIRIPFSEVDAEGTKVKVNVTAGETGAANVELALRRVLRRWAWK